MSLNGYTSENNQNIWNQHYIINTVREVYNQNIKKSNAHVNNKLDDTLHKSSQCASRQNGICNSISNEPCDYSVEKASAMNRNQASVSSQHGNSDISRPDPLHTAMSTDVPQNNTANNKPSSGWMESLAEFLKQNNPYKQDSVSGSKEALADVESSHGFSDSNAQKLNGQQKRTRSPSNLMEQYPQLSKLVASEPDRTDSRRANGSSSPIIIGDSDDSLDSTSNFSSPDKQSERVHPSDVMSPSTRSYVEDWLNSSVHFGENYIEDDNILSENSQNETEKHCSPLPSNNNKITEHTQSNQEIEESHLTLKRSPSVTGDLDENGQSSRQISKKLKSDNKIETGETIVIDDDSDDEPEMEANNHAKSGSTETNNDAKSASTRNNPTENNIFLNVQPTETDENSTNFQTARLSKGDGASSKSRSSKMISNTEMAKSLLNALRNIVSKQSVSKAQNSVSERPVKATAAVSSEEKQIPPCSSADVSSGSGSKHGSKAVEKSNVISENALGHLIDSEEKLNEYLKAATPIDIDKGYVDSPMSSELESPHLLSSSGFFNTNPTTSTKTIISTSATTSPVTVNSTSVVKSVIHVSTSSQSGTSANVHTYSGASVRPIQPKNPLTTACAVQVAENKVKRSSCKPNILSRKSIVTSANTHIDRPGGATQPINSLISPTIDQSQSSSKIGSVFADTNGPPLAQCIGSGATQSPLVAFPLIPVSVVPLVPVSTIITQNSPSVPSGPGLNTFKLVPTQRQPCTSTSSVGLKMSISAQLGRPNSVVLAQGQQNYKPLLPSNRSNSLTLISSNQQQTAGVTTVPGSTGVPALSSHRLNRTSSHESTQFKQNPAVCVSRNTRCLSNVELNQVQRNNYSQGAAPVKTYSMILEGPQTCGIESCIRDPSCKIVSDVQSVMSAQHTFTVVPGRKLHLPDVPDPTVAAVAPIPASNRQYVMLGYFTDADEGEKWVKALRSL